MRFLQRDFYKRRFLDPTQAGSVSVTLEWKFSFQKQTELIAVEEFAISSKTGLAIPEAATR